MKDRGNKLNKILDRYLGIPALLFLKIFLRKNKLPADIKNIGVIITPAIGDTILLQGLFRDFKEYDCKITVFAPKGTIGITKLLGFYDEIIEISYTSPLTSIKNIRTKEFDLMLDTSQWSRMSAIMTAFSKTQFRFGFKTKGQAKHFCFDDWAIHSAEIHEIYNFKKLNKFFTVTNKNLPCIELQTKVEDDLKRVVLHIPAGGYLAERKQLPAEHWKVIINYLLKRGNTIYFTGTAENKNLIDELITGFDEKEKLINFAGKYTLEQTAALLKGAALVISVNTGIMHLASALGCNLIALHGPTNPLRWGPFNKNSIAIKSRYKEAPCLNLGFEYNCSDTTCKCMKEIDTKEIINAIDTFIIDKNS